MKLHSFSIFTSPPRKENGLSPIFGGANIPAKDRFQRLKSPSVQSCNGTNGMLNGKPLLGKTPPKKALENKWDRNRPKIQAARVLARKLLQDPAFKEKLDLFFSQTLLEKVDPAPPPHYRGSFDEIVQTMIQPSEEQELGDLIHRTTAENKQNILKEGFDLDRAAAAQSGEGVYFFRAVDIEKSGSSGELYHRGEPEDKAGVITASYQGNKLIGTIDASIAFDLQENGYVRNVLYDFIEDDLNKLSLSRSEEDFLLRALIRKRFLDVITPHYGAMMGQHPSAGGRYLVVYDPNDIVIQASSTQ